MENKRIIFVIFIIILLIGGFLRFNHILDIGPFFADTAWRLSETRFLVESFKWVKDNPRFSVIQGDLSGKNLNSPYREFVKEKGLADFVPTNAKPYLNFFIAFFNLVFRIPLEDAGNVMAATFGVLVIFVAFLLGKTLYDASTGLISAAVAAVSAYQIMYSGWGFDLSPAILFVMLATLFYYRSRVAEKKGLPFLWLTGLSAGIAYGCHTSLVIFPGILLLYEIQLFFSTVRKDLKKHIKRIIVLAFSMLIPLLVAEIVYLYLRVLTNYPHFTYFEQLLFRFKQQGGWSRSLDAGVFILPTALLILEGYIVALFLVAGIISMLKKCWVERRLPLTNLIISTQFLLPLIWWSPHHNHIPRLLLLSLSTLPLVAGRGGAALANLVPFRKSIGMWMTIALIPVVIIVGVYNSRELIDIRPGYRSAFQYMSNHKGEKHLSTLNYVSDVYYKGMFSSLIEDLSLSDVRQLVSQKGYKYLLIDWQKYHYLKHPEYQWLKKVEEECKPVYEVSNQMGAYRPFLYENSYGPESFNRKSFGDILQDQGMGLIRIYDLADVGKLRY